MITLVLGIIAAVNPGWPPDLGQQVRAEMQTAAVRLGLQLVFVPAGTPAVFPGAFAAMAQDRAQALVVPSDFLFAGAANGPVIADSRSGTRLSASRAGAGRRQATGTKWRLCSASRRPAGFR